MSGERILEVESLSVRFGETAAKAVEEISFSVNKGEKLGIAGESGSGKTASILSILGLLPRAIVEGSAKFSGQELIGAPNRLLNQIRGKRIGLVLQDPFAALDPVQTIGNQIAEGLRAHPRPPLLSLSPSFPLFSSFFFPSPSPLFPSSPPPFSFFLLPIFFISISLSQYPYILISY